MVVDLPNLTGDIYEIGMLTNNKLNNLLPFKHNQYNGYSCYYYRVNSLQPLSFTVDSICSKELIKGVFTSLLNTLDELQELLLEPDDLLLSIGYIYQNISTNKSFFAYVPQYNSPIREQMKGLVEDIMKLMNHKDKALISYVYGLYDIIVDEFNGYDVISEYILEANELVKSDDVEQSTLLPGYIPSLGTSMNNNTSKKVIISDVVNIKSNNEEPICIKERLISNAIDKTDYNNDINKNGRKNSKPIIKATVIFNEKNTGKQRVLKVLRYFVYTVIGIVLICILITIVKIVSGDLEYGRLKLLMGLLIFLSGVIFCISNLGSKTVSDDSIDKENDSSKLDNSIKSDNESKVIRISNIEDESREDESREDCSQYSEVSNVFSNQTTVLTVTPLNKKVLALYPVQPSNPVIYISEKPALIGALDKAEYIISAVGVSRIHSQVYKSDCRSILIDMNSTNGTYVNQNRIGYGEEYTLSIGDHILFGQEEYIYEER